MTDKSVKLHSVLLKGRKSLPLNVVSTETLDIFEHFSGIIDRLAENCSAIYINACVWKYCKSRKFHYTDWIYFQLSKLSKGTTYFIITGVKRGPWDILPAV